ncbi:OmpA family protein [Brachybacterium sp.]|uniref:OmpA family protein n=1 Tax=Brachybacterium sp. TaxID=1891286 RepID=UPI002ECFF700
MDTVSRRQTLAMLGLGAALPVLAACQPDGDPDPGDTSTPEVSEDEPPPADPEEVVASRSVVTEGGSIEVAILPLVRADDLCVLTLDLVATALPEGEDAVLARRFSGDATLAGRSVAPEDWAAVRLVDPEGARIRLPASTQDGSLASRASVAFQEVPKEGARVQLIYAAPESGIEQLGLLLPGWYVPGIPVIDGEVPEVPPPPDAEPLETAGMLGMAEVIPVLPLEGYTRQLDGGVGVIESIEKVEIQLAGDVLFDSSSAELRPEAGEILDAAAANIAGYEEGAVDIVGHTDDVGPSAENLALSQARAESVARALSTRIDPSLYSLRTQGLGESSPVAPNTSDANRQLNRRVTLTLTSQKIQQAEVDTSGDVPPFDDGILGDGTEADAREGFEREDGGVSYRITAPSMLRVDGLLVLTVTAQRSGGPADAAQTQPVDLGAGVHSYRGDDTGYSSTFAGFAPRLLLGSTAIYPLDYLLGESAIEGSTEWRNATDTATSDRAADGDTLQFTALYRDQPGVASLIVEQPSVLGTVPFRLNDVAVEDA